MIGHTKCAAGVAGLIKAALALHHRVLPPTLGVDEAEPAARTSRSPRSTSTRETRPWIRGVDDHPRRAGVSAFGFGGTNFHAVLEEYTGEFLANHKPTLDPWPAELFLFRGDSRAEVARRRSARSQASCAAAPSRRWPTSRTRSPREAEPAAGRRDARDRRRLARRAREEAATPRRP